MEKGNITILPNVSHNNLKTQKVDTFAQGEVVNYGYIKHRDLEKWYKGENVAVKMGMLSPFKKAYIGLNIVSAALKRISEQDTTALFEIEDELVPVYVFVQKETDKQWREYLLSQGYKSARANREGIVISKERLFGEYGIHYNVETNEAKTLLEERAIAEEKRKKEIEKEEKAKLKKIADDYEKRNPGRKYKKDKSYMESLLKELKEKNPNKTYTIDCNFVITEHWYETKVSPQKASKKINRMAKIVNGITISGYVVLFFQWYFVALFLFVLGWVFGLCAKNAEKWLSENSVPKLKEKTYKPCA